MGDVVAKFIEPILAVIPSPKTGSFEGFVAVYAKVLDEFDDEVLELAADMMLRTAKTRSMPLPAECLEVCRAAAEAVRLRKLRASKPKQAIPEQFMWTEEMALNANRLFASVWGQRAVADKVEIALWDFLVRNQRYPNDIEYDEVKRSSLSRQADMRQHLNECKENGGLTSETLALLRTRKAKVDKLRELVIV